MARYEISPPPARNAGLATLAREALLAARRSRVPEAPTRAYAVPGPAPVLPRHWGRYEDPDGDGPDFATLAQLAELGPLYPEREDCHMEIEKSMAGVEG